MRAIADVGSQVDPTLGWMVIVTGLALLGAWAAATALIGRAERRAARRRSRW